MELILPTRSKSDTEKGSKGFKLLLIYVYYKCLRTN